MILSCVLSPCVSTCIFLAAQPSRMKHSPGGAIQMRVTVLSLSPSFSFSLFFFFCQMMKVRLQQPSGTELPPFNPILPPASIRQVVLLANPFKVRMALVEPLFSFDGFKQTRPSRAGFQCLLLFFSFF